MFHPQKLRLLLDRHNLTLIAVENMIGISNAYLSQMLSGKRPITEKSWMRILCGVENLSREAARDQLAIWRIEEGQAQLKKSQKQYGEFFVAKNAIDTIAIDQMDVNSIDKMIAELAVLHPELFGNVPLEVHNTPSKRVILKALTTNL